MGLVDTVNTTVLCSQDRVKFSQVWVWQIVLIFTFVSRSTLMKYFVNFIAETFRQEQLQLSQLQQYEYHKFDENIK